MRLLLGGDYFYSYRDIKEDFRKIQSTFSKYDSVVLNFEGALPSESKEIRNKSVRLSVSKEAFCLPNNTIFSFANNHISDFGSTGIEATLQETAINNIKWFGLESYKQQYDNYIIIEKNDIKICYVGFGWVNEECVPSTKNTKGVVDFTRKNIDSVFNLLSNEEFDILICYVHSGYEYEYYPLPIHVGLSRYLIDLGADIVYASHTHCIQAYELYDESYIFYGLGNFYFSEFQKNYPVNCDLGLALDITITESIISNINILSLQYDRKSNKTTIINNDSFLQLNQLPIISLDEYSKNYRKIRTRKKNPRPIYYYNYDKINFLKYRIWLFFIKLTGILRIRGVIKKLLGWA